MVKEIAFSGYPAEDVAKLKDFYAGVLGLECTNELEEEGTLKYAEFRVGTSGFFSLITTQWTATPKGAGSGVAFEVESVDRALAELAKAGVKTEEPFDSSVCRMAPAADPEGNRFLLHQTTVAH